MSDFGFGILEVASILGLKRKERIYGRSVDASCPFCGDVKYHLNLNIQKNTYRCNRCGESGGMLQLYGMVMNISNRAAYSEIRKKLGKLDEDDIRAIRKEVETAFKSSSSEGDAPNFEKTHKVYTSLFEEISLSPKHRANLQGRGLPNGIIVANSYRTVPKKETEYSIAEKLLSKEGIVDFKGVPGFHKDDNGIWKAKFSLSGFFIPIRNFEGKIEGAQIRSDSGTPKYISFSSSYEKAGTKATSSIHWVGRFKDFPQTVYLTEGPLKADIAHYYTGYPFLAVQGVNNQKHISDMLTKLKSLGVTKITECFDMDKRTNIQVNKAIVKIQEKALAQGFTFNSMSWSTKHKGIDDYLNAKYGSLGT